MQPLRCAALSGVLALLVSATGVTAAARAEQKEGQPRVAPAAASLPAATRGSLVGVWAYNAEDSRNVESGRAENAPGATHRTGLTDQPDLIDATGFVMFSGQTTTPSPFASLIANEKRDLVRDLLEVPTQLTITLADNAVTFVDHLDREVTFPTNGKKQKYQLSASVFEAKAYWEGQQLRTDYEGSEGFRMQETYFASSDAKRMFVIVRVGDLLAKDRDPDAVGINRVYDRVVR